MNHATSYQSCHDGDREAAEMRDRALEARLADESLLDATWLRIVGLVDRDIGSMRFATSAECVARISALDAVNDLIVADFEEEFGK